MKNKLLLCSTFLLLIPFGFVSEAKNESNLNNIDFENNMIYKNIETNGENIEHKINDAFDNNFNTYWLSDKLTDATLLIDLGEQRSLKGVSQVFLDEDTWYFKILGSIDNINFFEIVNNSHGEFGRVFEYSAKGIARYIKLEIYKSQNGFFPSSKEFLVNYVSLTEGTNLVLDFKGYSSSHLENYESHKAFDGDTGTYFCASNETFPQNIGVDLQNNSYVNKIKLAFKDYGTYGFYLEVKENGIFKKIYETSNFNGSYIEIELNKVISEARLTLTKGPGWASVVEFEIFGFKQVNNSKESEVLDLNQEMIIGKIISKNSNFEGSIDGINFTTLNTNKTNIVRYLRNINEDDLLFANPLNQNLTLNLSTKTSDYIDEEHSANLIFKNDSNLDESYYQSETKGGTHYINVDLGRIVNFDHLEIGFLEEKIHHFKIEYSLDGENYFVLKDFLTIDSSFKDLIIGDDDVKNVRYFKITLEVNDDEYATLKKFNVYGNGSPIRENWWQNHSGVIRYYPKLQGITLREITEDLDKIRNSGFKVIELHQPYEGIADIWAGLGNTNNYQVDPLIGNLEDLKLLLLEAHNRGIKVFMFGNVGYGKYNAEYFKKACKDYALGIDSKERNWFVFSDSCPDPTKWFWSDLANAYYYCYWDDKGTIPTFNFNNPEWQKETKKYISYWSDFGMDGIGLDAPDVYYWGNSNRTEITYLAITNTLKSHNMFCLPEGTGDTINISLYKYNCVQNYTMSSWGGGATSLGLEAAMNHSVKGVDDGVKGVRDTAVALGGVSMDCMNFEDCYDFASSSERILECALVTSTGHISFLHSGTDSKIGQDIMETWDEDTQDKIHTLFGLQNSYQALNPSGARYKLITSNEDRCYAFYKSNLDGNSKVLPVFNYSNSDIELQIFIDNTQLDKDNLLIYDGFRDEQIEAKISNGVLKVPMKANSYRMLILR